MLVNLEIMRIGWKKFEDYQNHIGCHIFFKFNYFQIRQGWGHYPLMRLSSVLLSFGPENSISRTKVYVGPSNVCDWLLLLFECSGASINQS